MVRVLLALVTLSGLAGCAGATLPYTPVEQPSGARLSAAYQVIGDRLRIEIDTNGRRLEDAQILHPDGRELRPQTIEYRPGSGTGYPMSFGVGVGGGSWGSHSGVGVGTGVNVGIPAGASRTDGNTLIYFPLDQAGGAPWRLRVKVEGIGPAEILVGGVAAPR
jgi:hypothetical protein